MSKGRLLSPSAPRVFANYLRRLAPALRKVRLGSHCSGTAARARGSARRDQGWRRFDGEEALRRILERHGRLGLMPPQPLASRQTATPQGSPCLPVEPKRDALLPAGSPPSGRDPKQGRPPPERSLVASAACPSIQTPTPSRRPGCNNLPARWKTPPPPSRSHPSRLQAMKATPTASW